MISLPAILIAAANLEPPDDLPCEAAQEYIFGEQDRTKPFWPSDYAALRLRKHWLNLFPDDCGQGQNDALAAIPFPSRELPQIALNAAAASVSTADGATAGADSAATRSEEHTSELQSR